MALLSLIFVFEPRRNLPTHFLAHLLEYFLAKTHHFLIQKKYLYLPSENHLKKFEKSFFSPETSGSPFFDLNYRSSQKNPKSGTKNFKITFSGEDLDIFEKYPNFRLFCPIFGCFCILNPYQSCPEPFSTPSTNIPAIS